MDVERSTGSGLIRETSTCQRHDLIKKYPKIQSSTEDIRSHAGIGSETETGWGTAVAVSGCKQLLVWRSRSRGASSRLVRCLSTRTGWTPGTRRTAHCTNVPPGEYSFQVIAANSYGIWNDRGASVRFVLRPHLYQTSWFYVFCAGILLAVLWGAYQLRVRQLRREFNVRLGERRDERGRIARELHDTLLQSFQGLMFSFPVGRNLLPGRTEEAIRTLDEAVRAGHDVIAEGRDAIQGLRANPGGERDLEYLVTAAGKELARSSPADGEPPAFQVSVEGARLLRSPLLQDEVYRIAREILRNAFQHAHASRIEVEIAYDRQFFRLRIRDNGKGIDSKVLAAGARQGHWGLPGVGERAEHIGRG